MRNIKNTAFVEAKLFKYVSRARNFETQNKNVILQKRNIDKQKGFSFQSVSYRVIDRFKLVRGSLRVFLFVTNLSRQEKFSYSSQ